MRMRKKRHGAERLANCAEFLAPDAEVLKADIRAPFGKSEGEVHLEIGCGKGSFAVKSAIAKQDVMFYAMEKVENVMINALERAMKQKESCIGNLRFIIGHAEELEEMFPEHSISVIYLNFSDPWPKKGHHRRRLTAPERLDTYKKLLVPGGRIIQKTDNRDLFEYSLEEYEAAGFNITFATDDLHASSRAADNITTEYEENFVSQGKTICCVVAETANNINE